MQQILYEIQDEMAAQVEYFKSSGKFIEAQRLSERVNYDVGNDSRTGLLQRR